MSINHKMHCRFIGVCHRSDLPVLCDLFSCNHWSSAGVDSAGFYQAWMKIIPVKVKWNYHKAQAKCSASSRWMEKSKSKVGPPWGTASLLWKQPMHGLRCLCFWAQFQLFFPLLKTKAKIENFDGHPKLIVRLDLEVVRKASQRDLGGWSPNEPKRVGPSDATMMLLQY